MPKDILSKVAQNNVYPMKFTGVLIASSFVLLFSMVYWFAQKKSGYALVESATRKRGREREICVPRRLRVK
eukprot:UN01200